MVGMCRSVQQRGRSRATRGKAKRGGSPDLKPAGVCPALAGRKKKRGRDESGNSDGDAVDEVRFKHTNAGRPPETLFSLRLPIDHSRGAQTTPPQTTNHKHNNHGVRLASPLLEDVL